MPAIPTLWKLHGAGADTLHNAGAFAAALRQHLAHTPAGVTSLLLQIGEEQSAYVIQAGCAGCLLDRCAPGCRVELLRRVLTVGYAEGELALVRRGLILRPYTRAVVAWPAGAQAQPLDASVLQGWTQARLALHWRATPRGTAGLQASVVLCVGAGADDPQERLRAIGWRGIPAPWLRGQPHRAPRWAERAWPHDPHLLTPVAATTHWLLSPPTRTPVTAEAGSGAGYANAAAIAQHLQEAGARVEHLDLAADGWTARVAATTATGGDPRPVWDALKAPGSPLELRDAATGALVLDPSQARPSGTPPPLLLLGARRDGPRRWRPLSATQHLALAGPIEGGVLLGMLAPAAERRPDLRIGVLDLTAAGTLDAELLDVPGRLPLVDGRNVPALLGAIGGLPDREQPVAVVVAAGDAAAAETALLPLLRAALYRPVSVLLVVPERAAIPALLQGRCPVIEVRQRVAQWQHPEGTWDWAQPTALRLPWRDPRLSWPQLTRSSSRSAPALPALEGFWTVPGELGAELDPATDQTERFASPEAALPPEPREDARLDVVAPDLPVARSARRSRIYAAPGAPAAADGATAVCVAPAPGDSPVVEPALPPLPAPALALPPLKRRAAPLPPVPTAPVDAAPGAAPAYLPREDGEGNLVVDAPLLALALQWAEGIDPENQGVSITRFKSGIGLPTKAHSFQLRDALRLHGLIRRELKKEGWYRLLTVQEAVRAGKLPPGPWFTPPVAAPGPDRQAPAPEESMEVSV